MTDRIPLYLHQMQTAAADACHFVRGMDRQSFMDDLMVQRAVGMSILMLGEAAVRLSREYPEFPVDHPDIPWQNIQGLRNRIAHGYFEIDMAVVWETVNLWLPRLLDQIESLHNWRAQGE